MNNQNKEQEQEQLQQDKIDFNKTLFAIKIKAVAANDLKVVTLIDKHIKLVSKFL